MEKEIKKITKRKLWEKEDNHVFGELFLIIGSVFVTKSIEQFFPNLSKWLYLGFGFLFVLWGVKLLRRG